MKRLIFLTLLMSSLSSAAPSQALLESQSQALLTTYRNDKPLWTWNWNWGTGILLWGLQKFAAVAEHPEVFQKPIHDFHSLHSNGPWRVMWSDQCIPALSALELNASRGDQPEELPVSVAKVVRYLKHTPLNAEGSLDHFSPGSPGAWFFPSSIWLDSLVMWGVFALHYGYKADPELFDFALAQGPIYKRLLWNERDQLFYHAWNLETKAPYPLNSVYWLRGNAWVMVYLIEALSLLEPSDRRYLSLLTMYRQLSQKLASVQREDGLWGTLVLEPKTSYPESSGSALIAYSLAKGVRLGLLEPDYADLAEGTWQGLQGQLQGDASHLTLGQISAGTNPGGREDYLRVPVRENLNYGLGAFFLLASELGTLTTTPLPSPKTARAFP